MMVATHDRMASRFVRSSKRGRRRLRFVSSLVAVLLSASVASAQVPDRVAFQGLLLDDLGTPLNRTVDLDFSLYDSLAAGSLLWNESQLGVLVVDGVYAVELGATSPLDASVFAAGPAFLEIVVDGEVLVPRQQLLAVPFAYRAAQAGNVGSVEALVLEQIVSSFAFDGQDPPNLDPSEGTADVDGDGTPNFIDPDNDGDGRLDADELATGNSINLVTPQITSISPTSVPSFTPTTVQVSGAFLGTVASVSYGAESPTATAISSTSFEIEVSSDTAASDLSLHVVAANGEASVPFSVPVFSVPPSITDVDPVFVLSGVPTVVTITGTGFVPGTTVELGASSFVPSSISSSEVVVEITSSAIGPDDLRVLHPGGVSGSIAFAVAPPAFRFVFATTSTTRADFGGIAAGDAICQSEAVSAGLSGTFRAWLSESQALASPDSPSVTFTQSTIPYVTTHGRQVADDWADLTDGTLDNPIDRDPVGAPVIGGVWTGTETDGSSPPVATNTCGEWTPGGTTGVFGRTSSSGQEWTKALSPPAGCATSLRLYCFEQ
ncbi:MAG: DUF1554 domain-containing protein [bacterium]|nr:DUF1554 domain-containing protein [bacterium]